MYLLKTVILSAVVAVSLGFQYSDLLELKDCNPFDSCERDNNTRGREFSKNCFCDDLCPIYADCCLNSEYYFVGEAYKNNIGKYSCVDLKKQNRDVYMKATCEEGWNEPEISSLCLKGSPESSVGQRDPVANIPATSMVSNITYANYYCAICNQDSSSLHVWNIGWECENSQKFKQTLNETYILSNLIYKNNTWGVNINIDGGDRFLGCTIYPLIPKQLENVMRNCTQMIQDCASDWTDENEKNLCQSYTSVIIKDILYYRNIHCAICNFEDVNDTSCYSPDLNFFRFLRPGLGSTGSFAVLFDFTDSSGSNIVGSISKCEKTEIWDPFFKKCRSVICGKPNQVFQFNRCVDNGDFNESPTTDPSVMLSSIPATSGGLEESTTSKNVNPILFPTSSTKASIDYPMDTFLTSQSPTGTLTVIGTAVASNATSELQTCHKILLYNEEFTVSKNGSVHVLKYMKVYTPAEYQLAADGIFVCAPSSTNTDKFSPIMAWVSLVGMGISCICLLIHFIAFKIVPDLRNLSGQNLASLCLALLASYVTFIINMFSDANGIDCVILAAAMYYFFLSSSCWMNATAYDIWHTFRLTKTELRLTAGKQWHRFVMYSLYSWLLPAIAVAMVVAIDVGQPEGISEEFLPAFGKSWCWFGHRKALLVFFAVPMTILIVLNCVFFISTARIITETTTTTASTTTSSHHKSQYKMHMRLAVLMGFTWLSGIVAGYLQIRALWYIFVVLNTLQGAFIFLAFTCRRKVWRVMGVAFHRMWQRGSSWIAHPFGHTTQNMELKNSSTSPSTSVDGL